MENYITDRVVSCNSFRLANAGGLSRDQQGSAGSADSADSADSARTNGLGWDQRSKSLQICRF
ncbi:hypothetical protein B9T62_30625 [Paenibacillus donghaensis]|uniref:Uncharacterized protein n=1 Tax=Paenibacillus donghaensis TaxID=414771 RepID=A0A2Z2KUI4_9BACL|nr:hypothetical protein B9T62_30625 [Paenibacillus donghaensis]